VGRERMKESDKGIERKRERERERDIVRVGRKERRIERDRGRARRSDIHSLLYRLTIRFIDFK
jgi:hypothetical protein